MTDILYKNDTVSQIYRVTGRDRLHVHAVASSGDEMEYFLHNVIDTLPGIISWLVTGSASLTTVICNLTTLIRTLTFRGK